MAIIGFDFMKCPVQEIRSLHKHNSKLMARVAEDKVRRIVEKSTRSPEHILRNEDPAVVGMMVERLSRELHERTDQLAQLQSTVEPLEQRSASLKEKMQKTVMQQKEQQVAAKQIEITLRKELKESEEKLATQRRTHEKMLRDRRVAEERLERKLRKELKENAHQADARHQMQEQAQHVAAEKMAGELRKEVNIAFEPTHVSLHPPSTRHPTISMPLPIQPL